MDKIGKYDIVRQIGVGGFGVVYEGNDPFLKRQVAIKTCTSETEELRDRFYREAEIAGKLQHRHIVTVHDFGVQDGVPYLVQEFLSGEDLDRKIARRRYLTDEQKLDILVQAAQGLEHAHAKGVIHRDIKPANIRVMDDGNVKIMDFGIAKLANVASHLTRTGMTLGTAAYLPPEQIKGATVDHRADIFSFGVTAYELLTYRRPFAGKTISKLFYQILNQAPETPSAVWPHCPPALESCVLRCLAKEPGDRYDSFAPLIRELTAVKGDVQRQRQQIAARTTNVIAAELIDDAREELEAESTKTASDVQQEASRSVMELARQLVDQGELISARETLQVFLSEQPHHTEAGELLAKVERQITAERKSSLVEAIERFLAAGRLDEAETAIAEAEGEGFTTQDFEPQKQRLAASVSAERLRMARSEYERGELEAAASLLEKLLGDDPEHAEALSLQQTWVNESRERELAARVGEIRDLLEGQELGRARRLYESVHRHYGETPELQALATELETLEHAASLQREAEEAVTRGRRELQTGDLDAAEAAAEQARALVADLPGLVELERSIEAGRKREERAARASRQIEKLLEDGHLDAAAATLTAAETQHGEAFFFELRARIGDLRRERLNDEVTRAVQRGRDHLESSQFSEAIAALEEALEIAPDDESALELLQATQSRLEASGDKATGRPDPLNDKRTTRLTPEELKRAAERFEAEQKAARLAATTSPPTSSPTPPASPPATEARPEPPVLPPPAPAAPDRPDLAPAAPAPAPPAALTAPFPWGLVAAIFGAGLLLLVVLAWLVVPRLTVADPRETPPTFEQAAAPAPSEPVQPIRETAPAEPGPDLTARTPPDSDPEPDTTAQTPPDPDPATDPDGEAGPGAVVASTGAPSTDEATPPGTDEETTPLLIVGGEGVTDATLLEPPTLELDGADSGPGFVLYYVLVGADGQVLTSRRLEGGASDPSILARAEAVVATARFEPAHRAGAPGRQWQLLKLELESR